MWHCFLGKYEVRATWTINPSSSTQMHLFLQPPPANQGRSVSHHLGQTVRRMKGHADGMEDEMTTGWACWRNAAMLVSHDRTLAMVWCFGPVPNVWTKSFSTVSQNLMLLCFSVRTINSHLKIQFPRDLYCCSVERTFWVSSSTQLLAWSWTQTSTSWHHYRYTLHCPFFLPRDDTLSLFLFIFLPHEPSDLSWFIEVEMSYRLKMF